MIACGNFLKHPRFVYGEKCWIFFGGLEIRRIRTPKRRKGTPVKHVFFAPFFLRKRLKAEGFLKTFGRIFSKGPGKKYPKFLETKTGGNSDCRVDSGSFQLTFEGNFTSLEWNCCGTSRIANHDALNDAFFWQS